MQFLDNSAAEDTYVCMLYVREKRCYKSYNSAIFILTLQ